MAAEPFPNPAQLTLADSAEQSVQRLTFEDGFLNRYAGKPIKDQHAALFELVANAWDAGAKNVRINWPAESEEPFWVEDDGIGMTRAEFERRWMVMDYSRQKHQGSEILFPDGSATARRPYGRNGRGRHAMFCFASHYEVRTIKDGFLTRAEVVRGGHDCPFVLESLTESEAVGHGTTLATVAGVMPLSVATIKETLGKRFLADPSFAVHVNGERVNFVDFDDADHRFTVETPPLGAVTVLRFGSDVRTRNLMDSGIAWWTQRRLVGAPGWDVDGVRVLDGRTHLSRTTTYIVVADALDEFVNEEWTGYRSDEIVRELRRKVVATIKADLDTLGGEARSELKEQAFRKNRDRLVALSSSQQERVVDAVDVLLRLAPRSDEKTVEAVVQLLANAEAARSGQELLARIASLDPSEMDKLNEILKVWDVAQAKVVLDLVHDRLTLIRKLSALVDDKTTNELHALQPLFEHALWMFGPQFESAEFASNRQLVTVIRTFFKKRGKVEALANPKDRPDFVVLPDESISAYSLDGYSADHEVMGYDEVLLLELKRGGFTIGSEEKNQGSEYALALKDVSAIQAHTRVTVFVLGSRIAPNRDGDLKDELNNIRVIPRTYQDIINQARARMFKLESRIKKETGREVEFHDEALTRALSPEAPELPLGAVGQAE